MTITMNDNALVTIAQLEAYTNAAGMILFRGARRTEKYAWIEKLLSRFFYFRLRKRDKITVRRYIITMTGYSDAQVTRLIRQKKAHRHIVSAPSMTRASFSTIYTPGMGYAHIPRQYAPAINRFYQIYFNTYVNFHRPSGYATTTIDTKGKEKKVYHCYETPYDHFKNLPDAPSYLKAGVTFEELDQRAYSMNDLECATLMQEAKYSLFKSFR